MKGTGNESWLKKWWHLSWGSEEGHKNLVVLWERRKPLKAEQTNKKATKQQTEWMLSSSNIKAFKGFAHKTIYVVGFW